MKNPSLRVVNKKVQIFENDIESQDRKSVRAKIIANKAFVQLMMDWLIQNFGTRTMNVTIGGEIVASFKVHKNDE